ncbi:hypothetical protein PISMIDRAFT_16775 [Pisolithus microcarpus 441]|uniref:CMP/dCMP-type deaminase domain-containing protein n=1 Tax=Pisolithus microcarpus 441 TaxID=765257 RepID=A0A0C9YY63_9AGAM|nr:hypothetical protein PISMIDRAFT_16775 [Pisolithus microcarpus 441]
MHKSNFYYSQCVEAASKSTMNFHLGAVLVKGGKVISSGHNHCRTHYDGKDVREQGHRKPASMHAEMHAIHSLTGMSPSFKQQVQPGQRTACAVNRKPCFGPGRQRFKSKRDRQGWTRQRLLSGYIARSEVSFR